MAKDKVIITRENGEQVEAQAPVIVSASRSTDIPAFYSDWFLHRLKAGYSAWTNPFNGVRSFVSYQNTRLIVFWSKNPKHLLDKYGLLDYLVKQGINCYVQFTLNDYVAEKLECGVPPLEERIKTFKALVDKLGKGKVIWRFDPLILTDRISVDDLLLKVKNIGDRLKGYTEKLVFSFADIVTYKKVKSNLEHNNINYQEFQECNMIKFASGLQELNRDWDFTIATCGEKIDIEKYGIIHNKCIDDDIMIKYFSDDAKLMEHLGIEIMDADIFSGEQKIIKKKNNKDKGQRQFCGCIASKDIGEYNTCAHLCEYCYANNSKEAALRNLMTHRSNPLAETITGK
ncbi:putative uncharacterized protein [Alistipes sp. CAG:831]|nr:putative uncharacterized protein [Alistipes sp. CAG:831]